MPRPELPEGRLLAEGQPGGGPAAGHKCTSVGGLSRPIATKDTEVAT